MNLTKEQSKICDTLIDWISSRNKQKNHIVVAGYAGTGKTYLASKLRVLLNDIYGEDLTVGFCTFTGKASSVLAKKLEENNAVFSKDKTGTIHSLMYMPIFEKDSKGNKIIKGWDKVADLNNYKLIIVDEGSMVNKIMWDDLTSYNIPIIVIGDHFQLPPIEGKFNLMEKPDLFLTEILRQESNELIEFANYIRTTGRTGNYPIWMSPLKNIIKMDWRNPVTQKFIETKIPWKVADELPNYQILCGMNSTRVKLNNMVRKYKFGERPIENFPYPGERIVCLRNNYFTKLMNGQMGTLKWNLPAHKDMQTASISLDDASDSLYNTLIHLCCFGKVSYDEMSELEINKKKINVVLKQNKIDKIDVFDFGYAISVHRAQGSEWDKIVVIEERNRYQNDEMWARWLYTAVTRARQKVVVITNF